MDLVKFLCTKTSEIKISECFTITATFRHVRLYNSVFLRGFYKGAVRKQCPFKSISKKLSEVITCKLEILNSKMEIESFISGLSYFLASSFCNQMRHHYLELNYEFNSHTFSFGDFPD